MTGKPDVEYVVEMRGAVCRDLNGGAVLAGPIDLAVAPGEFVCVIGARGSGKGALLRMIAGLLPRSAGTICAPPGGIGLVFDAPLLMPWRSAIENVLLLPEMRGSDLSAYRQRARRLLGLMGAAECEHSMPQSLPPGAAERVAICRAAIHNPPFVLMDDPFRGLDPLQREGIWMDLQRLWCGERFGVLMATTHVGEAVHLADRVAVLSDSPGRIVENIHVKVPRPRQMDKAMTPALSDYINRVRTVLQAQGALP